MSVTVRDMTILNNLKKLQKEDNRGITLESFDNSLINGNAMALEKVGPMAQFSQ